jgi:hypothetical protein
LTYLLKLEPISRYKKYNILSTVKNCKKINSNYIHLSIDELSNSDTVIMKSCTGTGKTTTTAKVIKEFNSKQKRPKKILSIISKKTLAKQHIKSFSDADINLINYLDKNKTIENDNIVCCINSIMLFKDVPEYEFNNYIVYIDEIASFLNDVTHNETLRGKLKLCYQILMRIFKNCHKLILSDAKINDNVFNFIKIREKYKTNTMFINNEFQKYLNVPAIRIRDEQLQLNMMIEHVKNNDYFLCASDSCKTITKLYYECKKNYTADDADEKFILITAYNEFNIYDASEQFINKFVFYSPSIIFGIDFTIDIKQDVFIYNRGRTLDPSAIFQQTTRTRNIKNLYYYSEIKNSEPIYENLEACKNYYENLSTTSQEINEVCGQFDDEENEIICKNTFFDIFTYNEYVTDIYQTNKTAHYENILKYNGFILSEIGQIKTISKATNKILNEPIEEIKENAFNELIENGKTSDVVLSANLNMLKLADTDNEIKLQFKSEITDKFKLDEHLNIIRCFKEEEFIQQKIFDLERDNYNITNLASIYHKIKNLIILENKMNIKRFEVDAKINNITFYDIPDNEFKLLSKIFSITKRTKPKNIDDLFKLYIYMVRHLLTSKSLTVSRGTTRATQTKVFYKINIDFIKYHIDLNLFSNPYLKYYDDNLLTKYEIQKPIRPIKQYISQPTIQDDIFIDDDDEDNRYDVYKKTLSHLDDDINNDDN